MTQQPTPEQLAEEIIANRYHKTDGWIDIDKHDDSEICRIRKLKVAISKAITNLSKQAQERDARLREAVIDEIAEELDLLSFDHDEIEEEIIMAESARNYLDQLKQKGE